MQNGDDSTQPRTGEHADTLLADNAELFGSDEVERPAAPAGKQWVNIGLFVLMLIAMIATGLVVTAADERKTSTLADLGARLDESVSGRRALLLAWVESRVLASRRLTESELVRMFVSDIALTSAGTPLPRSLLDQRPYFQTLISEFAEQNGLMRAAIIDRRGRLLLGSSGPALDVAGVLAHASAASAGWTSIVLPIRPLAEHGDDLAIDVLVPMPAVQTTGRLANDSGTIFVQTIRAKDVLEDLMKVAPTRKESEKIYLIQERNDNQERISLAASDHAAFRLMQPSQALAEHALTASRPTIVDGRLVYSLGKLVPNVRWTILHTVDARAAMASVDRFVLAMTGIAVAIALGATLCFATLWWRRTSRHHHELMLLYQAFADRLDENRRFLATIMNSMSDWLTVTNDDRQLIYVNPAFVTALGLPKDNILGRRAEDVLSLETVTSPANDFDGTAPDEPLTVCRVGDQRYLVATSWSDMRDQAGQSVGHVAVMRDQTELVEQRQQRLRALTETIDAFVHAIERRDPFLLGHTRRLRSYAIAVGQKLDLDDESLTAMALAASLSQAGKIFIPDEILVKPKRHNQKEADVMRRHIDHAISILGRIDFGFPVVEILSQMHERLDGSGYPNGLLDADIGLPGKILGAVDVFCARTAPRSYRDRLSAGHTLYHLANNASRYDVTVISALTDIVKGEGDLDPVTLNEGFPDSQVWKNLLGRQGAVGRENQLSVTPALLAI